MSKEVSYLVYLEDMISSAQQAVNYLSDKSYDEFLSNETLQSAVAFKLIIIGEAANRIPIIKKEMFPTIPWELIRGMRNRIVHDYSHIDAVIVWDTVKNNFPVLISELERVYSDLLKKELE